MAKRKVLEEEQAVYPSNYPPELLREVERWRAWHTPSLSSMPVFETARQVAEEKEYYEHDTIYRKQIGSLTARYDGKLKKAKRGNMKKIREAFDDVRVVSNSEFKPHFKGAWCLNPQQQKNRENAWLDTKNFLQKRN